MARLDRLRLLSLATFILVSFADARSQEDPLDGFDGWTLSIMKEWHVPGLGVAIVHDGEVLLAKGYGYRDLEAGKPVTKDTLFAIGSNTKSFTAALLGMLVDDGKLSWDRPVHEVLPELRLHDSVATDQMTAIDLLCHRSGLPRHDFYWYATGRSRPELLAGLRHLEPSRAFRSTFQYQNLMFLTAGIVAERVTGKTWETLVDERIFTPLGMDRAVFSVEEMQRDADFSYPYGREDEKTIRIPFRNIDAIGPAGSINASVSEMARYVQFHLDLGKVGDTRLLSEDNAKAMQSPQMVMSGPLMARVQDGPEIGPPAYGLGLMISSYRGHAHVRHGGGIDGFISAMEWLPDDEIGVIVLSNTSANGTVPSLVVRNVFDRLLGLDPIDWAGRARQLEKAIKALKADAKKKDHESAHPKTTPSHARQEYAGRFSHPGYGDAIVTVSDEGMKVSVAGFELPLEHYHYDVFAVPYDLPGTEGQLSGLKLRFDYDLAGDIDRVLIPLEPGVSPIEFRREGD
ncbi:MAG: serine hydrolase [Planctomycetota bacterium]